MRTRHSILKRWTALVLLCASAVAAEASASTVNSYYIRGDLKDITSVHGALMVRIDDDKVPTDCAGSGSPWMKINQSDTAMTSLVLAYWLQGKTRFTLYIDSWSSGYCTIGQADPDV